MGNGAAGVAGVDRIDHFDPATCPLISQDLVDGYSILAQAPSCRAAFVRYVRSNAWIKPLVPKFHRLNSLSYFDVDYLGECSGRCAPSKSAVRDPLLRCHSFQPGRSSLANYFKDRLEDEMTDMVGSQSRRATVVPAASPTTPTTDSEIRKTNDLDDPTPSPRMSAEDFVFSDEEMKSIVFAYLFPLFLDSREFGDWMSNKPQPALATSSADPGAKLAELIPPPETCEDRLLVAVQRAVDSLTLDETETIVSSGGWMAGFVAAVEDLRLCVSVAKHEPGHPLIYVNKAFECMTGYPREEVLGRTCNFLQCAKTEPEIVHLIRQSLKLCKPVHVALTNVRKDGSEFLNMLALKPVLDGHGKCAYVIGAQYDLSSPSACRADLDRVDELLSLLPRILL